ncbi:uncharacterized protein [Coffea arabica]|uniref:Uncharacterized protein n=1 Tax=Coffea arabica TaxID=13443 RepID=A0A6P6VU14_COFAR|nr:uncharacterized protein LOC113726858 [Coffea arabica]
MAASPALFRNPHCRVPHQKPASRSYADLFCKSLIVILVLLVIPLFPAQAPDFISQSILSKFWELFHLLVIGIAVSYGLFCRRCTNIEVDNQPRNDYSPHAYFPGVMNVSSFFEDGCEDMCNSDETKSTQNWDFMYLKNESMSKARPSVDDGKKIRSLKFGNGVKYIYEADKENVGHIWNSQYFQGENLVVVADGNYASDEHKPLGLPVRSLRSSIGDAEKTEFGPSNASSTSLKGSFGDYTKGKVQKFRSPVTINLEKEFDEVAGPSTIRWQSRSDRMEMREEVGNVQPPCHCRNHSGGNFEIENVKSRSVRHPISSGTSSVSPQPSNWKTENVEPKKDLKAFLDMFSRTTVASVDDGASVPTKARGFSIGSSRELDMPTSKGYFNDSNISAMQDMLDRGKKGSDSMKSDAKPSKLAKVLQRGRSVRTIRSSLSASDELKTKEKNSSQIDDNVAARSDRPEAPILAKKVRGGETKDPPVHTQKHNSRKVHPVPKETFSEFQSDEKQDTADSALPLESDLQLEGEPEDCEESSDDKESETDLVDNSGAEGSEVDRKADEFIAKFREQMRLQKIASVKKA